MNFIERYELWSDEQWTAADSLASRVASEGIEVVRVSFADQHGILRGKTVDANEFCANMREGLPIVSTLLSKDTSGRPVFSAFIKDAGIGEAEMVGAADMVMVPDPTTFQVLPWAESTGWVLCDLHFTNGRAVPFCTRGLLRGVVQQAKSAGYELLCGLEVEFHLFRVVDPKLRLSDTGQPGSPPTVSALNHGYQHLSEQRFDEADSILALIRHSLSQVGIAIRTIEVEYGPSQIEVTLHPQTALETADAMILLRSTVKQVAQRHGYHATFMCRPQIPHVFSSGWHLHQSLLSSKGEERNVLTSTEPNGVLSQVGLQYLGGLLEHARGAAVFAVPTINGFKRFQPYRMAPDRVLWGQDNRGALIRVISSTETSSTRLENRIGEPAANPYLYIASQLVSGLDGIRRNLDPGPSSDQPYDTPAPLLPTSLREALDALEYDGHLRTGMGAHFVDYFIAIKRAEVHRFEEAVTDWEQREYFSLF